jgi:hypothetical protein
MAMKSTLTLRGASAADNGWESHIQPPRAKHKSQRVFIRRIIRHIPLGGQKKPQNDVLKCYEH